jgi:hypothetical protein
VEQVLVKDLFMVAVLVVEVDITVVEVVDTTPILQRDLLLEVEVL